MTEPNRYKVERTHGSRPGARNDFVLFAHPAIIAKERLGDFAVVSHKPTSSEELRAPCRVLVDDVNKTSEPIPTVVCLDQTVRNAVGIRFDYEEDEIEVFLAPLRVGWWNRVCWWCSWRLGTRQLLMRVDKADPPDMEKEIARVPTDAFSLLGIPIGEQIIIEAVTGHGSLSRLTIRAYAITDDVKEHRNKGRDKDRLRYPDPETVLGVYPDMWPIYLDEAARDELHVRFPGVVKVRRNVWKLFLREVRFTFLTFAVAFLGLRDLFAERALAVALAIGSALVLTLVSIRAQSGAPTA